jgi:hypothetical protein
MQAFGSGIPWRTRRSMSVYQSEILGLFAVPADAVLVELARGVDRPDGGVTGELPAPAPMPDVNLRHS